MDADHRPPPRPRLTRDRIVRAAVDLADREGLAALTMRRLGADLGVEAMSLYKHVENKDAILDAIVEAVIGEIEVPAAGGDWKDAMRLRAHSARAVLTRHPWAVGLLEMRPTMGPAAMRYLDSLLGCLRSSGFAIDDAAHALWVLDSYVYGHVVQEVRLAAEAPTAPPVDGTEGRTPGEHPYLDELLADASKAGYTFDGEFTFGLELILDALEPSGAG